MEVGVQINLLKFAGGIVVPARRPTEYPKNNNHYNTI